MKNEQGQLLNLYETDFYKWTQETLRQIQHRDFEHIDWEHLAEEVEALGRQEKRGLKSHLRQLLVHLLLYQYWQDRRDYYTRGWEVEIYEFRLQLNDDLQAKTLYNYFVSQVDEVYSQARRKATLKFKAAGFSQPDFPEQCPYTIKQLLDLEFLPTK